MTAEKTLNILEVNPESLAGFLLEKQMEGYKIVGAEQTAHSTNFVDFKFPKKSILLLGFVINILGVFFENLLFCIPPQA